MDRIRDDAALNETVSLLHDLVRWSKASLPVSGEIAELPFGQLRVLGQLYRAPWSSVGDVAAGLGVSLATASELLDRMVDGGWVERHPDPHDRRKVLLTLTDKAQRCGDRMHELRCRQVGAALETLDEATRAAFVAGLKAVVASIEAPGRVEPGGTGS